MGLLSIFNEFLKEPSATAISAIPAIQTPTLKIAQIAGMSVADETFEILNSASQFNEREQFLIGKGITSADAIKLCNKLNERDRTLDDRRACAECGNWYGGRCRIKLFPIGESNLFTLHRCYELSI